MRWVEWLRKLALVSMWALAIGCLCFAVIRVFGLEHKWTGDTLIAFTPYVAILSLVPLAAALTWKQWIAAAVAGVVVVTFATVLLPRAFGSPDQPHGPQIRLMTANLKLGGADATTVMQLVRDHHVDVLAMQELTPAELDRLKALGLATILPYAEEAPALGATGSAVFSRYPISDTGRIHGPTAFNQAYGVIAVPGAQPVYFRSVHTRAPTEPVSIAPWRRDLDSEPAATPSGQVRVLVGDFNSTLDHAALRRLISTGYHDAADRLGDGFTPSWPYDGRAVPRITIDHVLADPRIGVLTYEAHRVPGTDHRSLIVTLSLPTA